MTLFGAIYISIVYWSEKYLLLRKYNKPEHIDYNCFLPVAITLVFLLGAMTYTDYKVFNWMQSYSTLPFNSPVLYLEQMVSSFSNV